VKLDSLKYNKNDKEIPLNTENVNGNRENLETNKSHNYIYNDLTEINFSNDLYKTNVRFVCLFSSKLCNQKPFHEN